MTDQKMAIRVLRVSAMTLALAAAFPAVAADQEIDETVLRLIRPESSVSLGLGYLFDENQRFGQYTGLNENGTSATLDTDIRLRDAAAGTWWLVRGHDLGRDSRDLRVEHSRQGDWSYFLEYAELVRHSQYTVNTGLTGIGSSQLTVNGTAPRDIHPSTRRESIALGYGKALPAGWDVSVRFKNEEKDGTRLFGRGTPGTQQWLAEPIDHTMQQLDVVLGFTGERFQLQTGYYGSFFMNRNSALNVDDPTGPASIASFSPIGLPPDNYAHQFYVTGGLNLDRTTRATFKLSKARATQEDRFFTDAAPTVGRSNLGGEIDTTLAQIGVTARPTPRISLLAQLRHMDRDDKTPVRQYFSAGGKTYEGVNEPRSVTNTVGKAEATFRLGSGYSLVAGLDSDVRRRNTSAVRVVSYREQTEEQGYRLALKRTMSETLNGAIAFEHADRGGTDFRTTVLSDGTDGSNLLAPIHLANRVRNKLKLSADWTPLPSLALQGQVEFSEDRYSGRELGVREGNAQLVTLDASYAFNDFWKGTAWALRNDTRLDQLSRSGKNDWLSHTRYQDLAFGLGVKGKIGTQLEVGADFSETHNDGMFAFSSATTSVDSLPDVNYRLYALKLYGKYQARKDLALRFDMVHERWTTNDWQWADYVYSDGTTLTQDPDQNVLFFGVTAIVTWR